MFESICIVGNGRLGSAASARLEECGLAVGSAGRELACSSADLVLLCVPDRAIPLVAQGISPGPWIAHTSGAVSIRALGPHERRFGLHPLQTFQGDLGPGQFDGAFAAITGETPDAREAAFALAGLLGVTPFELADDARPLYHAAATMAASFLVTIHRAAGGPDGSRRSSSRCAGPADAPHDGQRFPPDRTVRSARPRDRRPPSRGDRIATAGARRALSSARDRHGGAGTSMRTIATNADLRAALQGIRSGRSVGLVPTMGALHDGHLALIGGAREENDIVVATVFVNPTQFGEGEDLNTYPRDEVRDAKLAADGGVDLLFTPSADELYPVGFQTWVELDELGRILEGASRPGHFRGVATICLKLFNLVRPDRAYFGQKDVQQTAVIERMVRDLDLDLAIRVVPTVRDADGLALSSRNAYLSPEERVRALALPRALRAGLQAHQIGAHADAVARTLLAGQAGVDREYVEVVRLDGRLVLAAAIKVGDTRLIDNVLLEGDLP